MILHKTIILFFLLLTFFSHTGSINGQTENDFLVDPEKIEISVGDYFEWRYTDIYRGNNTKLPFPGDLSRSINITKINRTSGEYSGLVTHFDNRTVEENDTLVMRGGMSRIVSTQWEEWIQIAEYENKTNFLISSDAYITSTTYIRENEFEHLDIITQNDTSQHPEGVAVDTDIRQAIWDINTGVQLLVMSKTLRLNANNEWLPISFHLIELTIAEFNKETTTSAKGLLGGGQTLTVLLLFIPITLRQNRKSIDRFKAYK